MISCTKKLNCILLVDDDLAGNAFHIITLKNAGICNHIRTATSGRKALDYIIKSDEHCEVFPPPDLIFLDINMPAMNGFEFLEEYKKMVHRKKQHPVIIMLTTSSNPEDKERAMESKEVFEFQNKPLTVPAIHEILEKYFLVNNKDWS